MRALLSMIFRNTFIQIRSEWNIYENGIQTTLQSLCMIFMCTLVNIQNVGADVEKGENFYFYSTLCNDML